MNKISIGETVLHGYGFAARRIVSNLGLIWLAAVFYAVAAGYWVHQFCTTMLVSPHPGSELNDFALFDLLCLVVVTALGNAIMARALTAAALEPGGETMTAFFAVAKREWILFLSLLRLYALIIAGVIAVVLLGKLAIAAALPVIGANAQWQGIGALPAMNAAVAILALAVVTVLIVRLGFFSATVASAEHALSMTRAWSLSRGNSWRLFVVVLALSLPALLLWAAAEWALLGSDFADAVSAGPTSNTFYRMIDGNVSIIAGVWTALLVILNMLHAGASAPAYLTVRDNVVERDTHTAPIFEPALAGSFAGFAPRHAKEPSAGDLAPSAEAFPVKMLVAEAPAVAASAEDAVAEPVVETHESELPAHLEEMHEPLTLANEVHDAPVEHVSEDPSVVPFPLDAHHGAEHPIEHAEVLAHADPADHHKAAADATEAEPHMKEGAFTPLPSHADETESSQQNAPSEAA